MTTFYHQVSGARFLTANLTDLSGSDNQPIIDISADDIVLAIHFTANPTNKNPTGQAWSLEWRNVSDSGSFAALGNTGELTYNATTILVNGNYVTTWKCSDQGLTDNTTEGLQREGSNADVAINLGSSEETEMQIAIDLTGSDRANQDEYEFRVVDSTESQNLSITGTLKVKTAAQTYQGTAIDGISVGDEAAETAQFQATASDQADLGDEPAKIGTIQGAASDQADIADEPSAISTVLVTAADQVDLGDEPGGDVKITGEAIDQVNLGDETSAIWNLLATARRLGGMGNR
jgi:hypothetical protein